MNNDPHFLDGIEIEVFEKLYENTIDEIEYHSIKQKIELDSVMLNKYFIYCNHSF